MWRRLWQLLIFNSHDYLPLEEEGGKTQDTHREVLLSPLKGFAYLTAVISLLIIGGVVGFYIAPIGPIDRVFHYERIFAEAPSPESDRMWQDMFPKGRGFVNNSDISESIIGLSVFHQLHCLDAIRRAYYAVLDGTAELTNHTRPGHARHCIDYLRQSLICHADANIEPVNSQLGGVTGWNSPRKCRDISKLITWTDGWRAGNETDIL